jgi:hypothetical protein
MIDTALNLLYFYRIKYEFIHLSLGITRDISTLNYPAHALMFFSDVYGNKNVIGNFLNLLFILLNMKLGKKSLRPCCVILTLLIFQ